MKKILFILAFIFLIAAMPLLSAQEEETTRFLHKQGLTLDLTEQCINNGTYCSGSSLCNASIFYPNQSSLIINLPMTNNSAFHNITIAGSQLSDLGLYQSSIICKDGGVNIADTFFFRITRSGFRPNTAEGLIQVSLLIFSVLFFCLILLGAIKVPFTNIRSPDGLLIGVSTLKYIKVGLWFLSYLMLLWVSFILWNISEAFLFFNIAGSIFRLVFLVLAAGTLPLFIVTVFIIVIALIRDSEITKLLERGIQP